jgi:hypothetical protein
MIFRRCVIAIALLGLVEVVSAQTVVSVPLTAGASNKVDAGFFSGGQVLSVGATGSGDLVDSRYQVYADGSLAAAASGAYAFANNGATYSTEFGGDGFNHFVGGGANTDLSGNYGLAGFPFAGATTTDTTSSTAIRLGALVGTFSLNPARSDWFVLGTSTTLTVPGGGAQLYLAVNDSYSPDNHGTYSVTLTAIPETPWFAFTMGTGAFLWLLRRKRTIRRV